MLLNHQKVLLKSHHIMLKHSWECMNQHPSDMGINNSWELLLMVWFTIFSACSHYHGDIIELLCLFHMHLLDNLVLMGVFFMLMRNLLTSLSYTSLLGVKILGPAISKKFPVNNKKFRQNFINFSCKIRKFCEFLRNFVVFRTKFAEIFSDFHEILKTEVLSDTNFLRTLFF